MFDQTESCENCTWDIWKPQKESRALLVPVIVKSTHYREVSKYFKDLNITTSGYFQWAQTAPKVGACTAKCIDGSTYPESCCDTTSETAAGSCSQLGQEACCGDKQGDQNWCQQVAPPSCSAACAEGPYQGSCCDTYSSTAAGSCSYKPERCCGNTNHSVGWCQPK